LRSAVLQPERINAYAHAVSRDDDSRGRINGFAILPAAFYSA
jgi:hypothetical protein